jgi:hypothetical protein
LERKNGEVVEEGGKRENEQIGERKDEGEEERGTGKWETEG